MLVVLDLDKKMRMKVDVSYYVTGGILSMECKDEKWWPVAFLLNETEKLWNSWQGDVSSNKRTRKLETLVRRHKV